MRKFLLLLCLCYPAMLIAQEENIAPDRCVWRAGDDPAWAAPAFDDSAWLPYSTWQQNPPLPQIWIRCHADLSPLRSSAEPALQVRLYAAYQVFVNGDLIGSAGNLRNGQFSLDLIRNWPVPRELTSPATIAIRTTWRYGSVVPFGPYPAFNLLAGSLDHLRDHRSAEIIGQITHHLLPAICFCIVGVVGLVVLGLWLNDRSRHELLLLGINCIALPPIYLNYIGTSALFDYPAGVYFILVGHSCIHNQYLPHALFLCTCAQACSLVLLGSDCCRHCHPLHYCPGSSSSFTCAIALA